MVFHNVFASTNDKGLRELIEMSVRLLHNDATSSLSSTGRHTDIRFGVVSI